MLLPLLSITFISAVLATANVVKDNDAPEKNRMLGIDAIHDVKIDKNTIITRNLKLDKKKSMKSTQKPEDRSPDVTYSSIPQDLSSYVSEFKRNMSECLKETQEALPVRLSPRRESPVHGPCLIACVLKRSGVIEKGKVNKGNLLNLVGKFYAKDTKLMKKLEKNLDRCVEMSVRHHKDECELASHFNDCTNDLMASNKHKILVNY